MAVGLGDPGEAVQDLVDDIGPVGRDIDEEGEHVLAPRHAGADDPVHVEPDHVRHLGPGVKLPVERPEAFGNGLADRLRGGLEDGLDDRPHVGPAEELERADPALVFPDEVEPARLDEPGQAEHQEPQQGGIDDRRGHLADGVPAVSVGDREDHVLIPRASGRAALSRPASPSSGDRKLAM